MIKFKEIRDLIGVQDVCEDKFKLKGENVGKFKLQVFFSLLSYDYLKD